ncbi:hypothetical protein, partial [Shigella sonnei]|uniref:hypothetical protein n=1 Tax=Shigella sonnei TaxID=624 RepID=UPI001C0A6BC3
EWMRIADRTSMPIRDRIERNTHLVLTTQAQRAEEARQQAISLVRYGWTPRGELAAVYDRSNTQVRSFTYDDKYRGRMVAHRHTGRPEIRYRYDSDGRVTEQL